MSVIKNDLTIVYYTANVVPPYFMNYIYSNLLMAAQGQEIIVVSHKPMAVDEENIIVDYPRHHLSIYKQALDGARAANTPYVAFAEDDVLYAPQHFQYRPDVDYFAYNMNSWNINTWSEPMFTQKLGGRRNLGQLICSRELFIEAMEERFEKYPDETMINLANWAEPSKYEKNLGVTIRKSCEFFTNPPNIMFSHHNSLSYGGLGMRKRLGEIRALEIPEWGKAAKIRGIYK